MKRKAERILKTGSKEHADWLRAMVSRFERPLVSYAAKLLHGRLDLARDVTQDTFLRLCRQNPDDVRERIAPWLFTVCRNRVTDLLRKEGRVTGATEALDQQELPRLGPQEQLLEKEHVSRVLQELDALPEKQREVIRLKFQEGMSYKEIESITGLKNSYIGWLIHTGIKTLKSRLTESDDQAQGKASSTQAG